jgi:hypothetical protein
MVRYSPQAPAFFGSPSKRSDPGRAGSLGIDPDQFKQGWRQDPQGMRPGLWYFNGIIPGVPHLSAQVCTPRTDEEHARLDQRFHLTGRNEVWENKTSV